MEGEGEADRKEESAEPRGGRGARVVEGEAETEAEAEAKATNMFSSAIDGSNI